MLEKRDQMLARIRASLDKSRDALLAEARPTSQSPSPFVHPPQDDLAAQFADELARLGGHTHRCPGDAAALDAIRGILQQHAAASVIAWALDASHGNKSKAAALLQIKRSTLGDRIRRLTLPVRVDR